MAFYRGPGGSGTSSVENSVYVAEAKAAANEASTYASNASTSASTASTKASEASTSATNAATSASTASTKASEASTSATNAATSATNASNSATSASSSATTATNKAQEATDAVATIDAPTIIRTNAAKTLTAKQTFNAGLDTTAVNGGPLAGFRNKIINGNFNIDQRGVGATVNVSAAVYGHDRWRGGDNGCAYTVSSLEGVNTINMTSGSLQQHIEGVNLLSGTYTLSWTGTAQGRIAGSVYGSSGMTATITGGANIVVEFTNGTLGKVMLERSPVATPFEERPTGIELMLCQRYYQKSYALETPPGTATFAGAMQIFGANTGTFQYHPVRFGTIMRTTPTVTVYNPSTGAVGQMRRGSSDVTAFAYDIANTGIGRIGNEATTVNSDFFGFHFVANAEI